MRMHAYCDVYNVYTFSRNLAMQCLVLLHLCHGVYVRLHKRRSRTVTRLSQVGVQDLSKGTSVCVLPHPLFLNQLRYYDTQQCVYVRLNWYEL
jgi:hypothetical protein